VKVDHILGSHCRLEHHSLDKVAFVAVEHEEKELHGVIHEVEPLEDTPSCFVLNDMDLVDNGEHSHVMEVPLAVTAAVVGIDVVGSHVVAVVERTGGVRLVDPEGNYTVVDTFLE